MSKEELLKALQAGPVQVRMNERLVQTYDVGGVLEPGMGAQLMAFRPAQDWGGQLWELMFHVPAPENERIRGHSRPDKERLLVLETDPLDFFAIVAHETQGL